MKGIIGRLRSLFDHPYRKAGLSWWSVKRYKHLSPGKTQSHLLFGKPFFFNSPLEFLHGLEEIFVEEVYRQQLPPHPYIIDCGANMGMSIVYMKMKYPDAEILAFEPDEKNFELLSRNIASFGYEQVSLEKAAVWKEDTLLRFSNDGSMSSRVTQEAVREAGGGNSTEVKAIRLKDRINRPVEFLKLDIEGAEHIVLTDIADRLPYVRNLFVEYHGTFSQQNELNQILRLLTDNGFRYYIKEATPVYESPFLQRKDPHVPFDVQLNIFCFRPTTPVEKPAGIE